MVITPRRLVRLSLWRLHVYRRQKGCSAASLISVVELQCLLLHFIIPSIRPFCDKLSVHFGVF